MTVIPENRTELHVTILGFGDSGQALARYFCQQRKKTSITIRVLDTKPREQFEVIDPLIQFEGGPFEGKTCVPTDRLFVSPGIPLSIPLVVEARAAGIPISSDFDLGLEKTREPYIAITGTNGKTTTTSLIKYCLEANGTKVWVGGNIGTPLAEFLIKPQKGATLILEASSFQLEIVPVRPPKVAVFLPIEEDHLDRYENFEAYQAAKKNLMLASDKKTIGVFALDCPIVSSWIAQFPGHVFGFTHGSDEYPGVEFLVQIIDKSLVLWEKGKKVILDLSHYRPFGEHNKENLAAAVCAARACGASLSACEKVIAEFPGLPHRLEFVRKKEGVYFINDSKGTNPGSTIRALQSFPHNQIILIAGGKDKGSDFSLLASLVSTRCKVLVLLGEAKEKMNRALGDLAETYVVGTFKEAVLLAYQKSRRGDIVLLSPGCASFDMFRNYEERGECFKKLVAEL